MSPTEIAVIAVIFLVVFGPSKLPQMARDVGKFMGQARGAIDEFKSELTLEDTQDESQRKRPERSHKNSKNGRSNREDHTDPDEPRDDAEKRERAEYDL